MISLDEISIKVICKKDYYPYFTKGQIYEKLNSDAKRIIVYNDYYEPEIIVEDDDWKNFDEYFDIYY